MYVEGTSPITELIETLWNVNKDAGRNASGVEKELIETLWNVNQLYDCRLQDIKLN